MLTVLKHGGLGAALFGLAVCMLFSGGARAQSAADGARELTVRFFARLGSYDPVAGAFRLEAPDNGQGIMTKDFRGRLYVLDLNDPDLVMLPMDPKAGWSYKQQRQAAGDADPVVVVELGVAPTDVQPARLDTLPANALRGGADITRMTVFDRQSRAELYRADDAAALGSAMAASSALGG